MALARMIEMVARREPIPILQHANHATRFQMIGDVGFECVGEPEARQSGGEDEAAVVDDQQTFDPDLQRTGALVELPREEAARLGVAVTDAR